MYSTVEEAISQMTGEAFETNKSSSISGGSISQSQCITGKDGRVFFSKENDLAFLPFFEAEALALEQIRQTCTIRTPEVIGLGSTKMASFLVWNTSKEGPSSSSGQQEMGTQLARLHKIEQPFFGWVRDNCIGSTPQPNPKSDNWIQFYQQHRLQHQLQLAASKGRSFEKAETLLLNLEFSSRIIRHSLPCFMEISGEEMPVRIVWDAHLFSIPPVTMVTVKQTLRLPTCLADSVLLFTRRMKKNSRFIQASKRERFSTTFTMSSITSICLVGGMPPPPSRASTNWCPCYD